MLGVALLLQLGLGSGDSTYASAALRDFVARAAAGNRAPPARLLGYEAAVESELAFILRDSLGRELTGQVEQLAARATWTREGTYDVHVVGYRSQTMGNPYSALTFTRMYSVPTLYGERLLLGLNDGVATSRPDSQARRKRAVRDSVQGRPRYRIVHPLAGDRDRYYRFTGGDTVAVLHVNGRAIRLVRVFSHPVADPAANFTGFRGELDFDADRHQLVRMRGRFESVTGRRDPLFARSTGTVAVAYVEFENAEVDGKYWLPNVQRSEFQAAMGLLGDARPIYRIVTRFRAHRLVESDDSVVVAEAAPPPPLRATLTFARGDSASRYEAWSTGLGVLSGSVNGGDFDDLAPDIWKPTGPPRASFWPKDLGDIVRYNRIEGMFTGVSGAVRFRDAAPGLTARGHAGWAWTGQAVRGMATVSFARGQWTNTVRAERALATTNDFLTSLESGRSIGPLLSGVDAYDYADRWSAGWAVTRLLKDIDRGFLGGEIAYVRDRYPPARVTEAPLGGDFLPNRMVAEGDYARGTATLELHPRVTGESLSPGFGARVRYEIARGDLEWQRVDVRLAARQYWHGVAFSTRLDAGAVTARVIPPQALFEMGGGMELPSYGYKEFGGDRAALGRGLAAYYFPVLRRPMRLGRLILPGVSPGIGFGAQAGWTEASSAAARAALLTLGGDGVTPLSRPTGKVRSTIDARLTLLSGALGFGMARPVDEGGRWRPFFVWGAAY